MIIQQIRTGRAWGDRRDPVTGKARIGAATVKFDEFDHWDGQVDADGRGEYVRATRITEFGRMEWPVTGGKK